MKDYQAISPLMAPTVVATPLLQLALLIASGCGRPVSDPLMVPGYSELSPNSRLLIIPMGPLAAAAFESGMNTVQELKLLMAQVQDVAHVCNAVAQGDLSQKIMVLVQGVVLVQLKNVINTMVHLSILLSLPPKTKQFLGGQIGTIQKGR